MDSLTQAVLGAAIGEICLGKKLGWKASLLGVIGGTIPDLDIVVNLFTQNELIKLLAHRSYTHAWFIQIFMTLPLAYWSSKIDKKNYNFKNYFWFWYLAFFTHSLIDALTAYGTQLFLPFDNELVAFNLISVVDFLYTLPFLIFIIIALFINKSKPLRKNIVIFSLIFSTFYLVINVFIKLHVHHKFEKALLAKNIKYTNISTNPVIFNGFLWSGIIQAKDTLYCNEYSIFQKRKIDNFLGFAQNKHLSKGFEGQVLNTLIWFSNDYYILEKEDDNTLNFYNIKWGRMDYDEADPKKTFRFFFKIVKENNTTKLIRVEPQFNDKELNEVLKKIWDRIFHY
jgi:inner membrane protein